MAEEGGPAFFPISAENHAPWVVVTATVFLTYSIMAVISKVVSKMKVSFMKLYDWLILASILTALVQTICIIAACKNGLGQHRGAISADEFNFFSKYVYAAELLFIIANALAKASLLSFIMVIAPQRRIQLSCYAELAVVAAWAVSGIFARAFQCRLPQPWLHTDGRCNDEKALSVYLGIGNILTDIALIVIPSVMMVSIFQNSLLLLEASVTGFAWIMESRLLIWPLRKPQSAVQTHTTRKFQVMVLFGSRIIVPIFVVFQIAQYQKLYESDDRSWRMVGPAIWSQLVMNLSILTACVPSLKTVLDMFRSGTSFFMVPVQYQTSVDNSSRGLRSRLATALSNRFASRKSANRSQNSAGHSTAEWPTKQMKAVSGQHSVHVSSTAREHADAKSVPQRSESQRSLTQNGIMRTVAYDVEYEDTGIAHHAGVSDVNSGASMNSEGHHSY